MVRCLYNRWKVLRLISGAIGCNLAAILFAAKARLINARSTDAVQIFSDNLAERPHGKSLESRQHPNARPVPHLFQYSQIDRQSVVSGKSVSVRVDLGGRSIVEKKTQTNKYNSSLIEITFIIN